MKKTFCCILSVLAIFCFAGCQQSSNTVQAVKANSGSSTTAPYIEPNRKIIIDRSENALTYFYSDDEVIAFSDIEISEEIKCIRLAPSDENCRLKSIAGFSEEQNTDNIEKLSIENSIIDELSFVTSFDNLLTIDFISCDIKNTSVLSELSSLIRIHISDCVIDDISFLSKLPYLETIDFENTPVESIPALKFSIYPDAVEDHRYIYFKNCGETDISGLSGLKDFEGAIYRVDLSGSVIDDFSPLADTNITELVLSDTCGSNYNTLNAIEVKSLYLNENNLENIDFLTGNSIHTLFLNDNDISDWTPLLNIGSLVWCWTFGNPVEAPENQSDYERLGITIADSMNYAYPYVW